MAQTLCEYPTAHMGHISRKNRSRVLCHCHTKSELGWHQPSQAFFWHETNYRIDYILWEDNIVQFYSQCYTTRRFGWAGDLFLSDVTHMF